MRLASPLRLFLCLLFLALGLGLYVYQSAAPSATTAQIPAVPTVLEKESATLQTELPATLAPAPAPTPAVPRVEALAQQPGKALRDPVVITYLSERSQALAAELSLDAKQTAQASSILERHLPDRAALLRAVAASDEDDAASATLLAGAEAMRKLRRPGRFADDLRALLKPEQQSMWQMTLQKMAQDDAEIISTRELAAIQARHSLTEEQKDAIYTQLHQLALAEQGEPSMSLAEPELDDVQIQRRVDAIRSYFTPEQLEGVRRALDQEAVARWFLPLEGLDIF
jgi:hypothetical protein